MSKKNGIRTRSKTGSKASKVLRNLWSSQLVKSVAGSALVNRKKRT